MQTGRHAGCEGSNRLLESTVKWGNVVTFFAQNHIFSESFSGDLMLYVAIKIKFKKFLDVDMTIFGFCHHLGLCFPKNVRMTTLPTQSCNVVTSLYSRLGDDLSTCG
jgi:hypothetical protein